ncbi:hypothetical protein E2562_009561 [Oryza meyeriana var. granulata]|uniref:Uncharacterized protein n=1 Tax=Oryza meyeriana var. granulata TaxID=110450 RepID=A0A6G1F5V4_9ORYZ|nr:hypothetical protein E2562_009561 [Oryza meyeriana var. granulata]
MEMEAATPVPRSDGRKLARCPRLQMDAKTVTAIEQSTGAAIADAASAAGEGTSGGMRVKIVLSKQQLKQVAAAVAGGGAFALPPALEQLVSVLKRQHAKKQAAAAEVDVGRRRCRWSPALQSIPEECFS